MKKANARFEAIVGQMFAFSPEELEAIAKEMRMAQGRVSPGEVIWVQASPSVWFYHDPKVLRGDLERAPVLAMPTPQLEQLVEADEARALASTSTN